MSLLAHLTIRVAWHDTKWNGTVCAQPSLNSFCSALRRIREGKKPDEDNLARRSFDTLSTDQLPPCKAESGFFMSPRPWVREFDHPYRENKNCANTHSNLKKRLLTVPAYSAIAVPFKWMLRRSQKDIERRWPKLLAIDTPPPFASPWIFGRQRQEVILDMVFGKLSEGRSLAIFYTKEGHPLGEGIRRLIVGVGRITKVGKRENYDTSDGPTGYPLWDRVISHSIRPDDADGFLLPYHEYLAPTGEPAEDARRLELVREIAVLPPTAHTE